MGLKYAGCCDMSKPNPGNPQTMGVEDVSKNSSCVNNGGLLFFFPQSSSKSDTLEDSGLECAHRLIVSMSKRCSSCLAGD